MDIVWYVCVCVVETDDKPCGLVIICNVIGQVTSYTGGAAEISSKKKKKEKGAYIW